MRLLRLLPRFRRAEREMGVLEARERWSRAELEAFQTDRVNALWGHAVAHVPHYRELRHRLRLPDRFTSLGEFRASVPVLTKLDVRGGAVALRSTRPGPGRWSTTSGSTGQPTTVFWAEPGLRETLRSRYRFQASWGIDVFDRQTFLWTDGGAHLKTGFDRAYAAVRRRTNDWLRNRQRLSVFNLGPADLRNYLRRMAAFRPRALYTYSSAALLLAREALAAGFRCDSLRVAFLSAEPLFPHIVRAIEEAFGVPAVNEYGSVECGFIAGEGPDRTIRVREDIVLLETEPRADGRWGILVTPLTNPGFPLVRYAIGDTADRPLTVPARGFAVLANVTGRDHDLLLSRAGRPVHHQRLEFLMEASNWVRRFRAHQRADGSLSVMIEADSRGTPDPDRIRTELDRLLEGYPVQVQLVDEIPAGANGKHRWIVSDLTAVSDPRYHTRPVAGAAG